MVPLMSRAVALLAALRVAQPAASPEIPPTPQSALVWEAPAGCPTHAEVETAIATRVPPGAVRVRARVEAKPEGFDADVAIDSAHGSTQRRLASPSCTSVVDAIVLLAHVAAEPLPTHETIAPAPAPVPEIPALPPDDPTFIEEPVAPAAPLPETPPRERPTRPRPRATIGAAAIVGGGTLPTIDLGVLGTVGIATPAIRAELGALYLGPRRDDVDADASVRIDAWGMALRVCPVIPLPTTRVELAACATATAGLLRGESSGAALQSDARARQPWVRAAVGPDLAVVVHPRVRVTAAIEAGGHLVRPGFVIAGLGRVWAPRRWAAHSLIGLQVRL